MCAFYFAFGDSDAYVIVPAPDHVSVGPAQWRSTQRARTPKRVLLSRVNRESANSDGTTFRSPAIDRARRERRSWPVPSLHNFVYVF